MNHWYYFCRNWR